MAIPKYFDFFYPILQTLGSDEATKNVKEIRSQVAKAMNISPEDRVVLAPSGSQPLYNNRIGWALTYLKKAGLIASPSRGWYAITNLGLNAYNKVGNKISLQYLEEISTDFVEFRYGNNDTPAKSIAETSLESDDTPEDIMENAFQKINVKIADELLSAIMDQSPHFFERLVVQLLVKMGYGGAFDNAAKVVGKTNDEGIDGIIREDKLGFSSIYIQAKRWDPTTTIGRPEIQKFVGALAGQGATKGLFITTAQFSKDAIDYTRNRTYSTKVVLVDGKMLARLMIENDVGVSPINTYIIKKLDSDYFTEDSE